MKNKKEPTLAVYDVISEGDLYAVHRNGRYLMTPKGNAFRCDKEKLVQTIAKEWSAQGEKINLTQMPITQLMATTLDIVTKDRDKIVRGLLAYISSELLCHRVETPASLVKKQQDQWQPLIDWCGKRFDVHFNVGSGVMPIAQNPETTQRLHTVIAAYDDYWLAGLSSATDSAGSLILGLALAEKERTAWDVFDAAELDTEYQAVTWGDDPVTKARQAMVKHDLESCERWFGLLG